MATGEKPMSGNGAFAGFSGQKRTGFAALAETTSYGSLARTPGFAAAAKAAEQIRDVHESQPVKTKKSTQTPKKPEVPSDGFKSIQVRESGPRRIGDTLRRGFVRNSNASMSVTMPFNPVHSDRYAPSSGADWSKFRENLQRHNGRRFRVLAPSEVVLTLVSGEELMPLITARLQKLTASRRGKDYEWEVGQVDRMVGNLNDTLHREKRKEIDAEVAFYQEFPESRELAQARQLDPEHNRWLAMAQERDNNREEPFLDQPLSRWFARFYDMQEAYEGGRHDAFSLVATDTFDVLQSSRTRLLDIMGDVCGLDVSMLNPEGDFTVPIMETYNGSSWGGAQVRLPAIPGPMPLKAPQANNCEV